MDRLLRRWSWSLDGAVIAIAAIVAAHAAARWVGQLGACALPRHLVEEYVRSAEEGPEKKINAILRRNIFCHDCEKSAPETSSPSIVDRRAARPTSLPLRLVAVMYAPRPEDTRWSVAIIRDDAIRTTQPYAVGSRIPDATIDAIEATRVHLTRHDGQREVLDLFEPTASRLAGKPAAASGTAPPAVSPSFGQGIRQSGERRYEVQRRTLDAWLGNLPQLATEVRVLPEIRDGKPAGLRLLGIRAGGFLAALGLRNDDVIQAINGLDLDSPERAIETYLKLRAASHISIAADRGGRRTNLEYDIR